MHEVEFNITKKIGKAEFEIPVTPDDLMELLDEATHTGENIGWSIDGNGIRFYLNEDEQIGSIYYWECKNEQKEQQKETNI